MHNKVINLALVAQVAKGLKELNDKMVFIGGAVISLYTDDPSADEYKLALSDLRKSIDARRSGIAIEKVINGIVLFVSGNVD